MFRKIVARGGTGARRGRELAVYDLFDGGGCQEDIGGSRTLLSDAQLNLTKVEEEVAVQVETAYDKVTHLES